MKLIQFILVCETILCFTYASVSISNEPIDTLSPADLHSRETAESVDTYPLRMIPPLIPMSNRPLTNEAGNQTEHSPDSIIIPSTTYSSEGTQLRADIRASRNANMIKWQRYLLASQFWWYRAGNFTEGMSQVCQVVAPIFAGCAAAYGGDRDLSLTAAIVGSVGVGFGKFSRYAHRESAERAVAANKFLEEEGIKHIPVINDNDRSSSN